MLNILTFKSVRSRLTFWFLLVAVVPLLVFFAVVYEMRVQKLKEKELNKLSAIRDLKAAQINGWLDERTADIENIAGIHQIKRSLEQFDEPMEGKADPEGMENAQKRLDQFSRSFLGFTELSILHRDTGAVLISSNRGCVRESRLAEPYFQEPLRTGRTYIQDVTYSNTDHRALMTASTPIRCLKHNGEHIIAVLLARIDLNHSLYKLLHNRTGLGMTGETFIVNRSGLVMCDLRWSEDAMLKHKMHTRHVLQAINGGIGTEEADDYRGERVLAAYTHIPRLGWGFITKQDLQEVNSEIREMTLHMIYLLLLSVAGVFVISFFVAKTIARPVSDMAQVSQTIESGDLSARNIIQTPDELGHLAKTFNGMAESVQKQLSMLEGIGELNQIMMAARDLGEFYGRVLDKLIELTGSDFGASFRYVPDGDRFDPAASVGVSPRLLEPFSAEHKEGQLGKALTTGRLFHTTTIPRDTLFTFRTFMGTALPKEIVSVPIMVRDRAEAMISLASLSGYSEHDLRMLEHVTANISTALSSLMANEETLRLAGELKAGNAELKAQARELEQQSVELHQQNVELEMQRRQVEEASRLKSTFLSNMSHELRTPLNSVMALSKVLMMDSEGRFSEEELGYLEIIERNGKKLLSLINDILDLSKIEAGKVDLNVDRFSPAAVILNVMERLQPIADEKGLELIYDSARELPEVESDEARVDQVLQNIIGNAVKFTDGGAVTVSAFCDQDRIHIRVTDTGIGIPSSELSHIFEEFRQVDGSPSRRHDGTGLGLAIARRTAELLKGELTAESTYGRGSSFTFSLPIRWPGEVVSPAPSISDGSVGFEPERRCILVVDDDSEAVDLIADCLAEAGYEPIRAASGEEALRLARTCHPFAVTLDILMPGMDGWEVLQALKASPETADIPVLIVSVSNDKATGIALGAVGFIDKPVAGKFLVDEIRKLGKPTPSLVMIVDDNEVDRREMARILEQEGMGAISVESGNQCLEILAQTTPDVLVLDLVMPGLDGFEVLDRIRKDPKTMDLSVIIVTAKELTAEERAALSGRVSSALAKSETMPIALLKEIKGVLAQLEISRSKPFGSQRILMVEDNESAIIQVRAILEREGYVVDVASSGKAAIEYVQQTIPDGIILDLMMPEIDGFEVLEQIRSSEATATIPVLVLTAKDLTSEDFSKLSANNIQQLVQKGDVDADHLLFKIRLMLGKDTKAMSRPSLNRRIAPALTKEKQNAANQSLLEPGANTPTILIVEDNPDNMATIRAVLRNRYRIKEATDGEEGISKAISELPDLILLDMALPKMDGLTVLHKLRLNDKTRSIPVIALTARAMKGDREQILQAGCRDYISKPLEPAELLEKLGKAVKSEQ
jgi:CheY-like chemotaxis protein/signal transduction histidine kinase/HAMP domain-containing protein